MSREESIIRELERQDSEKKLSKATSDLIPDTQEPLNIPIGYISIKLEELPSRGLFYPSDTKILIRPANTAEIRHWSTIDQTDPISSNEHINDIVTSTVKFIVNSKSYSPKNILEMDRLYVLLSIRDITFKSGENKIILNADDGEKIELNSGNLYYEPFSQELLEFYNPIKKAISFKTENGEEVELAPPKISASESFTSFIQTQKLKKEDIAQFKKLLYIKQDKVPNDDVFKKLLSELSDWSIDKISAIDFFVDEFIKSSRPSIKYLNRGGSEVTTSISFPNGIKSLFLVSNIVRKISKN